MGNQQENKYEILMENIPNDIYLSKHLLNRKQWVHI